jgi:regulator of replication initiation timing
MNNNSPFHTFLEKQGENIDEQTESVTELVEGINDVLNKEFSKIREGLNIKSVRAEEASQGHKKGKEFEKDIVANLNDWQKYPDSFEVVGDDAQEGTRRKVGDVLATTDIGWEIVMEAKAGDDYGDTGDKSLDKQMDEAMSYYSESRGSIAVTTTSAMDKKGWQNSLFLDRGKNRFIVALDWKPVEGCDDYTVLRIAYMLLRERILAESSTTESPSGSGIDPKKIREITDDIVRDMSSAKKMRQIMTDVEKRINAMREEITNYQNKIQSRVDELNTLL